MDTMPNTPRTSLTCAVAEATRRGVDAYVHGRALFLAATGEAVLTADRFGDLCETELQNWLATM